MDYETIAKPGVDSFAVRPNLDDYEGIRAAFDYERVIDELEGLPGGGLNIAFESLDRHVAAGRGEKPCILWYGKDGRQETFTYEDMAKLSNQFANVLKDLGVGIRRADGGHNAFANTGDDRLLPGSADEPLDVGANRNAGDGTHLNAVLGDGRDRRRGDDLLVHRYLHGLEYIAAGEVDRRGSSEPQIDDLEARMHHLLETTVVPVERRNPKNPGGITVDVRPYVDAVDLVDGAVEMTLLVTDKGTAKPAEIAALLGYPADAINYRIRRLEITWQ